MSTSRSVLAALTLVLSAALLPAKAAAQPAEPLPVDQAFSLSAQRGEDGSVRLNWDIAEGYYLYRDRIGASDGAGESLPITTPQGEPKDDPYFGRLEVYHADMAATVPPAAVPSRLTIAYQGCQDDGICYAPQTRSIDPAALTAIPAALNEAPLFAARSATSPLGGQSSWNGGGNGTGGGWTLSPRRDEILAPDASDPSPSGDAASLGDEAASLTGSAPPATTTGSGITTDASAGGLVATMLDRGGSLLVLAGFLAMGLGLAFTPCVFPMYPVLAGQLGRVGNASGKRSAWTGGLHSAAYVLGLAAAFGLLGFVAAWSGENLQIILQSPAAILTVSALFVLLALSMFGAFTLQLPAGWVNGISRLMPAGRAAGTGMVSSGSLGFLSALIVGPCVTAPLAGALLYIAQTGDAVLGAAALFALGLGQGLPLIAFGTVGGGIMPKAGAWMDVVTRAFGFGFLAMAIWMATRILPGWVEIGLWGLLLVACALALLQLLGGSPALAGAAAGVGLRTASIALLVYGGTLLVGAVAGGDDPLRPLAPLTRPGIHAPFAGSETPPLTFQPVQASADLGERLAGESRPTLLYFTADWCISCEIIDRQVLADERVRGELADYRLLKADVTALNADNDALMKELSVVGPPTMIFLDEHRRETPQTRIVGELHADQFLQRARANRAGGS